MKFANPYTPKQMDITIAKVIALHKGCYAAACYLRTFGWSLDAARCILLSKAPITK